MTGSEFPHASDALPIPATSGVSPDIAPEQSIKFATLDQAQANQLESLLTDRLSGIEPQRATAHDSLDAMQAARMTTALLTEALTNDPEGFSAVSGHRGPIATMSHQAVMMHQHQTGHGLPEARFSGINPTHQQALEALQAIAAKVTDRRWDSTRGAAAMTADARKTVALAAVRGLGLMAEQRGRVLVSPATADEVVSYFRT